jgi:hypothetical protein
MVMPRLTHPTPEDRSVQAVDPKREIRCEICVAMAARGADPDSPDHLAVLPLKNSSRRQGRENRKPAAVDAAGFP